MWVCVYMCVFDNGGVFLCSQCGVFERMRSSEMGLYTCVWVLGFALLQVGVIF